jgi:hypothetical protein
MDTRNYQELEGMVMDFNAQQVMGLKDDEDHPLIGEFRLEFKRARDNKAPKILHASSSVSGET